MWQKQRRKGFAPRNKIALRKTSNCNTFAFPGAMANGKKADVFVDGSRVAVEFSDNGEFAVFKASPAAATVSVSAPSAVRKLPEWKRLPQGTTDVEHTREGEMYVIDLAQINDMDVAAE